jgi:uncharacterized lipoprotein YddW (UPF0748 family)
MARPSGPHRGAGHGGAVRQRTIPAMGLHAPAGAGKSAGAPAVGRRTFLAGALGTAGALAMVAASGCQRASGPAAREPRAGAQLTGCAPEPGVPRQLRGTWIASFKNLDWPSRPGLAAAAQQRELTGLLDLAAALRLNAVLLQVRPTADALYPSPYEPWSKWLTGTQGTPPGYDPLAFAVAAAHDRGLELHAWFNPFRVSEQPRLSQLAPAHPARRNPGWVVAYGGQLWYDPGSPAVREMAADVIADVARRYDLDGVHLDDYFYPYPVAGLAFPDERAFRRYGDGFASRGDWRRHNVSLLVAAVSAAVRTIRPLAVFGVSPFGIWRNAAADPAGSPTSGLQAYDGLYADALGWIRGGLLDYVAPQLYWKISDRAAPYEELVRWWSRAVAGTCAQLYVGQAAYRAAAWADAQEIPRHLAFDRGQPGVTGELFFHARSLTAGGLGGHLAAGEFAAPAYPPVPARLRQQLRAPGAARPPGWLRRAEITCAGRPANRGD